MTPIRSRGELEAALTQPRALLFLWVNWAIHARWSHRVVETLVTSWQSEHPEQELPWFTADITEGAGELWDALAEWLAAQELDPDHLLLSGVGPLLWLRSGRVLHHTLDTFSHDLADLTASTRTVFTPNA